MNPIVIITFSLLSVTLAEEKTIFVLTHFRHGARAPQKYINETLHLDYALESWDNPGELTPMGKRMHYALGLRNRERYIKQMKFLKDQFDPHEILIYSTRFNRTLLSVASQLQGLYPFGTGEELTEAQKKDSVPMVELSSDVRAELDKIGDYSLPGKMSLAPIRMINDNERKVIIYDISSCLWLRNKTREENYNKSQELQDLVSNFFNKYKDPLKEMYGNIYNGNYDIHLFDNFCDAYIAGTTEKKDMKNFKETAAKHNINETELLDTCFEFMKLNFKDWISGDENRTLPTLESSKFMREFIHYMKARVDAHINGEYDEIGTLGDYSKPKMIMFSAHDSTTSMWEMFLIKVFFDNKDTYYEFPRFANQLAFEVVIDESKLPPDHNKTYEDYTINYYFNDKLIFNKTVEEFISKVEKALYSDEEINTICKFDKIEPTPTTEPTTENTTEPEEDKLYFTLTIVFGATTGLFLILAIFFIIKATRSKSSESINKEGQLLNSYD